MKRHTIGWTWGLVALLCLGVVYDVSAATPAAAWHLRNGDRVVLVGDTFVEREAQSGWIETMLTARHPEHTVTFRNLGWSADTPGGASRFGLSLLQAGHELATEGWEQLQKQIAEARPTVVMVGYGMASSFEGEAGVPAFRSEYRRLLDAIARIAPGVRFVLLGPPPHFPRPAPWSDATVRGREIERYAEVVREIALEREVPIIELHAGMLPRGSRADLTDNGIHLLPAGYRAAAEIVEDALFGSAGEWRASPHTEALRQAIVQKNAWAFHRLRPANMAYIFGFRKREQGKNAAEIVRFDALIAAEETRIARLRTLRGEAPAAPVTQPANIAAEPMSRQTLPEFVVGEGLEVSLWAENPLLHKPVQMNFDARGRLWVASSSTYPQLEPGQPSADQIIVLEDTNGGGRADKATVFADGLLIPTGLEVGSDGVFVAQSTELLHLRDTDGDGKADVRRVVLSGFGTEDTHHNLHTLRWGPDGRLYMNQSVYTRTDAETPHGVVRLKAGGVFRFDPRDQRLEVVYRGWLNAWGHQFDAFDQPFVTDGAGNRGVSWAISGATYQTLAPARKVLQSVSPGSYPKFCGLEIVHSPSFPDEWQGDAITCDFRAHRVVRFKFSEQGAGFVTTAMPDLLRTTASTFRPIDARLGPDGALYIADWSNPIIQHGEVDFRDPRRDKVHGRIWRVATKGRPARPRVDLTQSSNRELFEMLAGDDGFKREHAFRVLMERDAQRVLADLESWSSKLGDTREAARWRACRLFEALGTPSTPLHRALLTAKDARVRAAAVRALPASEGVDVLAGPVRDPHPRVRLEAIRALGQQRSARAAELALSILTQPVDPFLEHALWLTMNELAVPWLEALKSGSWSSEGRMAQLEFGLKAVEPVQAGEVLHVLLDRHGLPADGSGPWLELVGSAGGPRELRRVFDAVCDGKLESKAQLRALEALANAARLRAAKPAGDLGGLRELLRRTDATMRSAALRVAAAWKLPALVDEVLAIARAHDSRPDDRRAAFAALREIGGASVLAELQAMTSNASPAVRREAVTTLAAVELPIAIPHVVSLLRSEMSEPDAETLWRALLEIRGVSARLARELTTTELPVNVARAGLRPAREGTQHEALAGVLLQKAGLNVSTKAWSAEELQREAKRAVAQGNPQRGERIYRRAELACVACHAIGGVGGKVGPDLSTIGASAPADYLLEALVAPAAKIKEGYHAVALATSDGRELSGMVVRENGGEVVLRDAVGRETSVAVQAITRRTNLGSLMPAGLIDSLLPEERDDLMAFLSALGKPGDYDASEPNVARVWKVYSRTPRNEHLGLERIVAGDFSLPGWQPLLARANGALPADALTDANRDQGAGRGFFVATQFHSDGAAEVELKLRTEGVVGVWYNSRPVELGATLRVAAKAGVNTLVLQLDQDRIPDALKVSGHPGFIAE